MREIRLLRSVVGPVWEPGPVYPIFSQLAQEAVMRSTIPRCRVQEKLFLFLQLLQIQG